MRLPRNLSGDDLIKALTSSDYQPTRPCGSHVRLTTDENGRHDVTVSLHDPLRVGALAGNLRDVAVHFGVSRDELAERLFS